jgi:glutathione S-transferase
MLELYHFHGATCGLKSRLAMAEKGIEYVDRAVDRSYLRTPEYRKLNPNSVAPTLIHDGEIILESSCIINYIDDAFNGPSLKPGTPLGVARTWWWMKRADECLPMIGTLTYTISMRPKLLKLSTEERKQYIDGIPVTATRERRRRIIEEGFQSSDFPQALQGIQKVLLDMEKALNTTEWLSADQYSLADTAITPIIERIYELQCSELVKKHHGVSDWYDRTQTRPSYEACLGATPNPESSQHKEAGIKAWPQIKELLAQ